MTTEISIHDARPEIVSEFPTNGMSMGVRFGEVVIQLYFIDIEQWWALRNAIPKASNYVFVTSIEGSGRWVKDHEEADAAALEFYEREKASRQHETVEAAE